MKVYTSVVKGLTLKVRKFWGKVPTFAEVTGKKVVGGGRFAPLPIINRVKGNYKGKPCRKTKKYIVKTNNVGPFLAKIFVDY